MPGPTASSMPSCRGIIAQPERPRLDAYLLSQNKLLLMMIPCSLSAENHYPIQPSTLLLSCDPSQRNGNDIMYGRFPAAGSAHVGPGPALNLMAITLRSYQPSEEQAWNQFVGTANEGTLFHRLDFLSYHGKKFAGQESHLVWCKGQTLFGVMPMAIFEENGRRSARSPYGASYGGPVFQSPPEYAEGTEIVYSLLERLAALNVSVCTLTLPLSCYCAKYSETLRLVLIENGFACVNRDISNAVGLPIGAPIDEIITGRARNTVRKAEKLGIRTAHRASVADFQVLLDKTYDRLGIKPTHTVGEFAWLCEHLPEDIYVDVAYKDDLPIAGIGFFTINKRVNSSFYLCRDPEYKESEALSLLIRDALRRSQSRGFAWFDFGTSSAGMRALRNLFMFKESFGAVGLFRETYQWEAR